MTFRAMLAGVVVLGLPMTALADETTADGAALFKRSCAMCHGTDGKATTPAAKKMGVKNLSLTELTDERIRGVIMEGVRGAKGSMPAFGAKFTVVEVDALIAHVRTLSPAENAAKSPGQAAD